jgi:hypothetical protein
MTLRSEKVIFSLSKNLRPEKYPVRRFNHFSTTSTYINPSNKGISKFTCTLKGAAWSLDEDSSPMGNRQRIYTKFSIISFLCCTRDSLRNILKGYPTPSYLFASPMGFCWAQHERYTNGLIGLSTNFLYLDHVEDMHEKK